jgi:hypothetical protein
VIASAAAAPTPLARNSRRERMSLAFIEPHASSPEAAGPLGI